MLQRFFIFAAIPLLLLAGCESAAEKAARAGVMSYVAGDFNAARADFVPLADKPDQNFVLNNCRLGSSALAAYDLDQAQSAFFRAHEVMDSVGVNDGGRTLGATLVDEKVKVWKGEPYERAMANFYLGLTFYMRHDYNNARAAFENALFKLRDYKSDDKKSDQYKEVESNFALGLLMLGKSWQRLGREDLARGNFERAVALRPSLSALADYDWNDKSNVLLVIDFGYGPRKITDGDGSIVGLGPTPQQAGPIPRPMITLNNGRVDLGGLAQPPVDLLRLAQDRTWQSIDTIRVVKSAVGTGLIAAGAYEASRSRNAGNIEAGVAMAAVGLLLKATSQADVRQWEMLPRTVFILPLRIKPGTYEMSVGFPEVPGLSQTWRNVPIPDGVESTFYFRTQPYNVGPFDWPPNKPPAAPSSP
ncbi:hypothetical protein BH10PLA1_BH10PLA1_00340 [soil metagenome]